MGLWLGSSHLEINVKVMYVDSDFIQVVDISLSPTPLPLA